MHYNNKHYVFYEDGNEYIPLKIALLDVPGYYNIFEGDSKKVNFKLDDNSLRKLIDIFDLYHYSYDDNNSITYFKTKVSDEICFRKDKDKTTNTILNKKTKYNCRVLLQILSVYYNNNEIYLKMKIVILK